MRMIDDGRGGWWEKTMATAMAAAAMARTTAATTTATTMAMATEDNAESGDWSRR